MFSSIQSLHYPTPLLKGHGTLANLATNTLDLVLRVFVHPLKPSSISSPPAIPPKFSISFLLFSVHNTSLMGSNKEEEDASDLEYQRVVKTSTTCFWSVVVSVVGGLILGWWEYQYHPTYRQLWMVPFGLILFSTPVTVWFSVVVSEICNLREDPVPRASQPIHSLTNSVPAKKDEQWSKHVDDV